MVEAGRWSEMGGPDLRAVADGEGAGRVASMSGARRRLRAESGEVVGEALGEASRGSSEPCGNRGHAASRQQEFRRWKQDSGLNRFDRALVGRVERAQRVDLVPEELDPDGQRERRRKDVDNSTASRELAAPGHLEDRHVPEVEQVAQQRVLVDPGAASQLARQVRQVSGRDRVLEECLDARDEDAGPSAAPGGERGHPGRGLVGDQLAAFVGQRRPRLQGDDGSRIAEPRPELLGDAVADLGIARDPDQALAGGSLGQRRREVALGAVRDGDQADMSPNAARSRRGLGPDSRLPGRRSAQAFTDGGEGARGGEEWRERREVGQAVTTPRPRSRRAGRVGRGA